MKAEHLNYDDFIKYIDNPIGREEDKTIENHLFSCDQCETELAILDGLTAGIKALGSAASKAIRNGISACLTNDEILRYSREESTPKEKKEIVKHLAGCHKCIDEVFALKKLFYLIEAEPALIKKGSLISKFVINYRSRTTAIENMAKELVRQAAFQGIALLGIKNSFSFAFKGEEPGNDEPYEKIDTGKFVIETIQIAEKKPSVIIGITAINNIKRVRVTISSDEKILSEELLPLKNRRAILRKSNWRVYANNYIKVEDAEKKK